MKKNRRDFIKASGLTIAATGIIPSFLASCSVSEDETVSGTGLAKMTEGVEPLTEEDYKSRQMGLVNALEKCGMDAIFIEGSTNLRYFFNISWWLSERTFGPIISIRNEPVWICPEFEKERASEQIPEGQEIRTWKEHESPFQLIAKTLK